MNQKKLSKILEVEDLSLTDLLDESKKEKKLTLNEKLRLEKNPELNLTILKNTIVNVPTQERYDTLMQVYELGGWKWASKRAPTDYNNWMAYKKMHMLGLDILLV